MPKNEIKKDTIDKEIFMKVLAYKKLSIRKLGNVVSISCTERTIRRSLSEKKMTPNLLDRIARYLDIDPSYLSGKYHREANLVENQDLKKHLLKRLNPHDYPYFRKVQDDQRKKPIIDFFERMFSLFDISYNQFSSLEIEKQFELQHDIFESIIPVLRKYFDEDGYGQKGLPNIYKIIFDLENFIDNYYETLYADTTLRARFAKNPPHGITREEILQMSPERLIFESLKEQNKNEKSLEFEKHLLEKYDKVYSKNK